MNEAGGYRLPEVIMDEGATTQDYVYQRLRNAIMVGAVPPETSLTFRGLASALGLSPTPIREALRRLSSENAVEILGNRRLFIPAMTERRFEELALLRINLECYAATRSLPYVSDIVIEKMRAIDDEIDETLKLPDLDHLINLNYQFHATLYELNPDQAVMPLIRSVWLQLGPFHRLVTENVNEYYQVDRHKEITSALRLRDPSALTKAIESDIQDGIVKAGLRLLRENTRRNSAA